MQGTTMERSKLQALAAELAKDIKTEADLNALSKIKNYLALDSNEPLPMSCKLIICQKPERLVN